MVALGPLLLTVNTGMISGYSAILLPQLEKNNSSSIEIDSEEASWIGKVFFFPPIKKSMSAPNCFTHLVVIECWAQIRNEIHIF